MTHNLDPILSIKCNMHVKNVLFKELIYSSNPLNLKDIYINFIHRRWFGMVSMDFCKEVKKGDFFSIPYPQVGTEEVLNQLLSPSVLLFTMLHCNLSICLYISPTRLHELLEGRGCFPFIFISLAPSMKGIQ